MKPKSSEKALQFGAWPWRQVVVDGHDIRFRRGQLLVGGTLEAAAVVFVNRTAP